jgi:shikimate dehydrogenase
MKYGLIGEKLSHSFSKEIHESLTDYNYELRELAPNDVPTFLRTRDFDGINVTIPYKENVIPYLDSISDSARMIGAVNTIKRIGDRLVGDNTDFYGMREMILRSNIELRGKKVLILGSGGTSKTAIAVSSDLGAEEIITVSRKATKQAVSYQSALSFHTDADIIINTTPVGMYPNTGDVPIDIRAFPLLSGVIDVIYNPLRTRLVLEAQELGIPTTGGLTMLILQAARAAEIFTSSPLNQQKIEHTLKTILASKENITLIGMPSCGKSVIGAIISELTDREFIDTDKLIEKKAGTQPSDIIRVKGEKAFRDIETEIIREISKKSGIVIATGGGTITREENILLLRQNGRIFYLDCPLYELSPTPDRPLSSSFEALSALYIARHPLYLKAADATISVSHKHPARDTANNVLKIFSEMI